VSSVEVKNCRKNWKIKKINYRRFLVNIMTACNNSDKEE
jgi:hypothetical protein